MPRAALAEPVLRPRVGTASLITVALLIGVFAVDRAGAGPLQTNRPQEKKSMSEISGEFDVKLAPVDTGDDKMGMMTLEKQYHGDLNATGQGRMLTGMTEVKGSAAYVAIERVRGKLKGVEGTFLMHHTGVMSKGSQSLVIRVVPDSGTGGLSGIDGEMHIKIAEGKHFYRFEYTLGSNQQGESKAP
jgi:Protein of unknown function (DUF3224)